VREKNVSLRLPLVTCMELEDVISANSKVASLLMFLCIDDLFTHNNNN